MTGGPVAKELVGLIGIGKGPKIAVPSGRATVKIKGLLDGVVVVRYECGDVAMVEELMIVAGTAGGLDPGSFAVALPQPVEWVQFECIEAKGQPVCSVRVDNGPEGG